MSQRLNARLKALQLPPPIRVDETRNSILLVGIGGVGKTSLIKALIHDPAAEPDTTGPFSEGVRFECKLGSAARDLKIGELRNTLRDVRGTETP